MIRRLSPSWPVAVVSSVLPCVDARAADVSAWCDALKVATVRVEGDFVLFRGEEREVLRAGRAGSGFWIDDRTVVTAHHVISRMDRIAVCGSDEVCHAVVSLQAWPEADLAVLLLADGDAPLAVQLAAPRGPGQELVAAGYPGDVGFVCGPGHVTGAQETAGGAYVLFEGTVAAEGSSGGPIVARGKSVRKLEAIGAVSGATSVGSVRFNRGAPVAIATARAAKVPVTPEVWRTAQPWSERRSAELALSPGDAYWEDLPVPALVDIELGADPSDGLCLGLYRAPPRVFDAVAFRPEPLAWTCDAASVRYTTSADEVLRIGLWSDAASGWHGRVELRSR
jgi:hypothetical protein